MIDNTDYYWYKKKKKDIAGSVFAYIKHLDNDQNYRQAENGRHLKLYGNYEVGMTKFNRVEPSSSTTNKLTLNIVQSMVDTVHSKITKNKPKPMFLTNGGDWSARNRAKKLNQFIEAQFLEMGYYKSSARRFLDACIFGTGATKIYKTKDGKIRSERIFIDEIMVDDYEAIYGTPRQLHQRKWVHKDVLLEMFPKHKTAIESVNSQETGLSAWDSTTYSMKSDMILTVESWKLPSGPEAKDGKHTITIENETLFVEEYTKDYFPFVFDRWTERPLGFFGQGLAEQLTGIQYEINKILRTIQVSMHLVSIPKIFVEAGSKIVSAHINNKIGSIIKYAGTQPEGRALGSIPSELFSHLDRLYQRAYEIAGISQLSAQAQKPGGLDSGKALRTYNDIESERFMAVAQRHEQTYLDAAKIIIDLVKEVAEEKGSFPVKVRQTGGYKEIDWSDIDLEADQYIMQMYPTSAMSSTPSARLQEVQELIQAGFVNQEEGMKLLNYPDIQELYDYKTAPTEDIDRAIEKMIDDGEYQTPEPYQNLEAGKVKMQQAYLYYKNCNAPEERLELLRTWISDAQELQDRAAAAAVAEQEAQQRAQMEEEQAAQELAAMEEQEAAMQAQAEQQALAQEQALAEEALTQEAAMAEGMPIA